MGFYKKKYDGNFNYLKLVQLQGSFSRQAKLKGDVCTVITRQKCDFFFPKQSFNRKLTLLLLPPAPPLLQQPLVTHHP